VPAARVNCMRNTTTTPGRSSGTDIRLLDLDDGSAIDAARTGGKAAALAVASRSDLPTLPGVVFTTEFCRAVDAGEPIDVAAELDRALRVADRLVVRSSSVAEDTAESSAAGQFESVVDVRGREELADAVRTVLDSRGRAGADGKPIAVLVQPLVEPELGGVLFGVDPVTGRSDRRTVTAVDGQPGALVSGEVNGSSYVLDRHGRVMESERDEGPKVPARVLRDLVELGDRAAEVFGSPQDVEWAVVDGRLVLLQSRPVTSEIRGVPSGPVYGPGPVAETFPERLKPLEVELWIPPLEAGVREALRLAATVPPSDLEGPDLVVSVDGFAAIDLERTGEMEPRQDRPPWFAVAARIRRLQTAWRVGRLRSALPTLADRLVDRADADLETLPPLAQLTDRQLVALLGRGGDALRSLHAHEVLMGLLTDSSKGRMTGASVALRVLAEARTDGIPDDEIVTHSPVVLALVPPRIAPVASLPAASSVPDFVPGHGEEPQPERATSDAAILREALRLRVRWVQELTGRAAWELGRRLAAAGRIPEPEHVAFLTYEQIGKLVARRVDVSFDLLENRRRRFEQLEATPLPARFRLSNLGVPVPEPPGRRSSGGTGAGGGRGRGVVTHDTSNPPKGSVLVVRNLTPSIGPLLTRLEGVVSETGSVLAHLAILAREVDVATVVGHAGALEEFPEGSTVEMDGDDGTVSRIDGEEVEDR
jgi:rifampicin phosphotransferase